MYNHSVERPFHGDNGRYPTTNGVWDFRRFILEWEGSLNVHRKHCYAGRTSEYDEELCCAICFLANASSNAFFSLFNCGLYSVRVF